MAGHLFRGFTLIELLVVMMIMAILVAILLPALTRVRNASVSARLKSEGNTQAIETVAAPAAQAPEKPALPLAQISRFDARVGLTPRLSVGTAEPESIYEATFDATLTARGAQNSNGDSEIQLPLPPQIISLGDLNLSLGGQPSDALSLEKDRLIWRGPLPPTPAEVRVRYTAVGRGLYSLQTPPGKIIDQFKIELTANGSDVQMLELSLQPTSFSRASNLTTYVWDYKRLMFGRPISLDVVMSIIAWRVISIMGWKLGVIGVILPAAAIMTLTLAAAVHPNLQGILITALVLAIFMLAMMLAPRFHLTPPGNQPGLAG